MASPHVVRNVSVVGACALLASAMGFLLKITLLRGGFARYTVNFVYDAIGFFLAGIILLAEGNKGGASAESWWPLLLNALSIWLYQWASLFAYKALPLAVIAGLNSSINPLFAAVFSAVFLSERPTLWFVAILGRNVAVIWLMLAPLLMKDSTVEYEGAATGVLWVVLISFSVGASLTLQRKLRSENPVLVALVNLGVNTLLWMPPGISHHVRVPFLWPPTENDGKEWNESIWVWLVGASVFGVCATVLITKALQMMDIPTFVLIFGPVLIGLNCLFDVASGTQVANLTLLGLSLAVMGVVVDVCLGVQLTVKQRETEAV